MAQVDEVPVDAEQIRERVRQRYGQAALRVTTGTSCCSPGTAVIVVAAAGTATVVAGAKT